MQNADYNSVISRTWYRLVRQLRRLLQKLNPQKPPTPPIEAQSLPTSSDVDIDPRQFHPSEYGSGAFGRWIIDDEGLPAYRYEMDHYQDDKAMYPVSIGAFRRHHWHQLGNDRITALATNDGSVQAFIIDQGAMFLNYVHYGPSISIFGVIWETAKILVFALPRMLKGLFIPSQEPGLWERIRVVSSQLNTRHKDWKHSYGGGFGYIYDGKETWSTAYAFHPNLRKNSERVFGMGYYKTRCEHNNIRTTRTVYAPAGDIPALIADLELTNTGDKTVQVSYYEYWDINIHQMQEQLLRWGLFGAGGDDLRHNINREFTPCIIWDAEAKALRFHLQPKKGAPDSQTPDPINWKPDDIFLADLSGTPDGKFTDKAAFFGAGGAEHPESIGKVEDSEIRSISGNAMPYCMVLKRDLEIEAGATVRMRFAYGTVQPDKAFSCDKSSSVSMPQIWTQQYQEKFTLNNPNFDPFAHMQNDWKARLGYFAIADTPHIQREVSWHSYYFLSSMLYNQYFDKHVIPQGSAYLFLHGIDGVPRDFSLYIVPLVYLNPGLAREMLGLIMNMTYGDSGQIAYSYTGNGILTGTIVHGTPSDLDLFFLLAMAEYLAATGDESFLSESVPFYKAQTQPTDTTVLNHIRVAFRHLMDDVGIGETDLIRVHDGDWSDDVVLKNVFPFAPLTSPIKTIEEGESVMNTQMAIYILPRIAAVLANQSLESARKLGEEMQAELSPIIERLKKGIDAVWMGSYYARAILRYWWNGKRILHKDLLDLESQVWALITDHDSEKREILKNSIYDKLDAPSPIGATLKNGSVWPAISQLLTWAYTRHYPDLAWRSYINHSLATRAEIYGHRWINIWSGPDGTNGATMSEPGGTYESPPATPMTDFPLMNNNQHGMHLLGLIRVCGIEPLATGKGLRITPQIPERFVLDMQLIKLDVKPKTIKGEYRAQNTGTCTLHVKLAAPSEQVTVHINGDSQVVQRDAEGYVSLELPAFKKGDVIPFELSVV